MFYEKNRSERTNFSPSISGRSTDFEEEYWALKALSEEFPNYFPEVYGFQLSERGLESIYIEELNLESKIEYTNEFYDVQTVTGFYEELSDLVTKIHHNENTPPHGDLIGNVWVDEEEELKILDPRGLPTSEQECKRWIDDDIWQLEWIKESLQL